MSQTFADVQQQDLEILQRVSGYTMTSIERQLALISATRYILRRQVAGCFVECGVWRGGSSMATAITLSQEGACDRDIYLYDTFEGMTEPSAFDTSLDGTHANVYLKADQARTGIVWAVASLEDVHENMKATQYPSDRIHFIKGPIEETIPIQSPDQPIALLRLDTDWYESTKHELTHLFPLLSPGGILIIDDYGHWQGAKKAVDEYLSSLPEHYYLQRLDYTGRLLLKF